jgi:hypothetical protein
MITSLTALILETMRQDGHALSHPCGIKKYNESGVKTMSHAQTVNEIKYKTALSLLNSMLEKGLITLAELKEIDRLNQNSFTPCLAEVYVQKHLI